MIVYFRNHSKEVDILMDFFDAFSGKNVVRFQPFRLSDYFLRNFIEKQSGGQHLRETLTHLKIMRKCLIMKFIRKL